MDPFGSYFIVCTRILHVVVRGKEKDLFRKELKTGLIILIIRKKPDFNTLENCISSS
jgi:hypothetical protein